MCKKFNIDINLCNVKKKYELAENVIFTQL